MNKDLYEILGLSRNASDSDIKHAYKKLALQYHPDRQGGKTDAEKKAAEEKFKEIGFAYSILSDPEKKQRYDQFGITDDQQQMNTDFDPSEIFKHFMGGFGSMFGDDDMNPFGSFFGRGRKQHSNAPQKGKSVRLQVPISIEEICKGVKRDIKFDIQVRCSKCHGLGGDGVDVCQHCHGTGMITEITRSGYGVIQNSHPCQYCGGTGERIKNPCPKCKGTGFETKEVTIPINIPAGIENGYQSLQKGKGYESKDKNGENGDVLLEFIYNFDTSKYSIQGDTLYEIIEVPYYDCILGKVYEHTAPNGDKIKVNIPEYSTTNTLVSTTKKFGRLYYTLVVKVKMPTYIRNSEKELLEKIRKEN